MGSGAMTANPADLAPALAALFPPGVVAAELLGAAPVELLTATERECIGHSAGKRIADFAAGRACARRALAELGIGDFSLLPGVYRQPLWPAGVLGSITHTDGYSAAVIARKEVLGALGVDCEVVDAVKEGTWRGICAPEELERITRMPLEQARAAGALLFAAKETFYKCQFPLTGEWVGFADVVIESADWRSRSGEFRVVPRRRLRLQVHAGSAAFGGRFCFRDQWVMTGMALAPVP